MLNEEIDKKKSIKKRRKKHQVNRVNPSKLRSESWI